MLDFRFRSYLAGETTTGNVYEPTICDTDYVKAESISHASFLIFERCFRQDFGFLYRANPDFVFSDHFTFEWFLTLKGDIKYSSSILGEAEAENSFTFGEGRDTHKQKVRFELQYVGYDKRGKRRDVIKYHGFERFIPLKGERQIIVTPWEEDLKLKRALEQYSKDDLILLINKLRDIEARSSIIDTLRQV